MTKRVHEGKSYREASIKKYAERKQMEIRGRWLLRGAPKYVYA